MTRSADDSGALDGVGGRRSEVGRGWRGDYSLRSWWQGGGVFGSSSPPPPCAPAPHPPSPPPLAGGDVSERQLHLESGADGRCWIGGQGPAVGGDNAARQVQPNPEPRGPGATSEAIEETWEELRGNT